MATFDIKELAAKAHFDYVEHGAIAAPDLVGRQREHHATGSRVAAQR